MVLCRKGNTHHCNHSSFPGVRCMKLRHCFVGTVLIFLLCKAYAQTSKGSRHLTPQEIQTITNAVQDEIYDYGYFKSFYQIGQNVGTPENWSSRLRIFINPMY